MAIQWQSFTVADLQRVLEFVGFCYRETGFMSPHLGDVAHRLSNGMRGQNIESTLRLFVEADEVRAVLLIEDFGLRIFSLIVHPSLWGTSTERELYATAEKLLLALVPILPVE